MMKTLEALKEHLSRIEADLVDFVNLPVEEIDQRAAKRITQQILDLGDKAESLAEEVADRALITITVGEYGYGRTYYPKGHGGWEESEAENKTDTNTGYWVSSSEHC